MFENTLLLPLEFDFFFEELLLKFNLFHCRQFQHIVLIEKLYSTHLQTIRDAIINPFVNHVKKYLRALIMLVALVFTTLPILEHMANNHERLKALLFAFCHRIIQMETDLA